jgi:hypothetical protein
MFYNDIMVFYLFPFSKKYTSKKRKKILCFIQIQICYIQIEMVTKTMWSS